MLFPTESSLLCQKYKAPTMAEEPFLCLFVSKRREMVQPLMTKDFLQPAKAVAMFTTAHLPLSHLPLFASTKPSYFQNGLCQLITCGQICVMSSYTCHQVKQPQQQNLGTCRNDSTIPVPVPTPHLDSAHFKHLT